MSPSVVGQHMDPATVVVGRTEPVLKAWRMMKDHRLDQIPVIEGPEKWVVGLITTRDIVQLSQMPAGQSLLVEEAMSLDPLCVVQSTPLHEVLKSMVHQNKSVTVVLDDQGEVRGTFSWKDAMNYFMNQTSDKERSDARA